MTTIPDAMMKRVREQIERQEFVAYYTPRPWWCAEMPHARGMTTRDYTDPARYFSIYFPNPTKSPALPAESLETVK